MNDLSEQHASATLPADPTLGPVTVSTGPDGTTAVSQLLQKAGQAVLREEIEVWINEGGAGDEPGP